MTGKKLTGIIVGAALAALVPTIALKSMNVEQVGVIGGGVGGAVGALVASRHSD
ncbi:MAG: hypothetical protein GY711_01510 [bacterium]|nr:hypothetical protein [bacterium]